MARLRCFHKNKRLARKMGYSVNSISMCQCRLKLFQQLLCTKEGKEENQWMNGSYKIIEWFLDYVERYCIFIKFDPYISSYMFRLCSKFVWQNYYLIMVLEYSIILLFYCDFIGIDPFYLKNGHVFISTIVSFWCLITTFVKHYVF